MEATQLQLDEKTCSSNIIYQGKILTLVRDLVELPNGNRTAREVVRHNGGVCILALDAEDNILFVRQFRYPYGEVLLELPAGKLEKDEDPIDCGKRELREETGYVPGTFRALGVMYPSPGYTDEVLHLFVATDLTATQQALDADEFLTVESIPFQTALTQCLNGEIADAKTALTILKYHELRRQGLDACV